MKLHKAITLILIALITVLGIHVVYRATEGMRADATEDNLFSLTDGTGQIIKKMHTEGVQPIDIKLYFSLTNGKTLPKFIKQFIVYEDYVRSLLREYERTARGKIRVQVFDPITDSDEAQDALDYGLDGKPINQHGDLFFFGLAFVTQTGSKDKIEFLWPNDQENIEYEISKKIYSLLWPKQKRVAVLSSLDVLAEDDPYMQQLMAAQGRRPKESWISMQVLGETYEVSRIDPDTDHISRDEHDLLVVVHPKSFSDKTLWAIDEWITTGGNAVVLIDPYAIEDQPPQNPQQPWAAMQYKPSSNLERLTRGWGVTRPEDLVAADVDLGLRRQVSRLGGVEKVIIDLYIDDQTREQTVNQDHPITRDLNTLRFFMAGGLEVEEKEGIEVTPLITTTAKSNTLKMMPGFGGQEELAFLDAQNPAKLRDAFSEGSEPVNLACLIRGKLGPAFPDGASFPDRLAETPPGMPPGFQMPPPEDAEIITKEPIPADQHQESSVLLIADVDVISNQIGFQQSFFGPAAANDNYKILLNGVDFLLGSSELMNVRGKSSIERSFVLFDEIEEAAEAETQEREKELRAEIQRFQEEVNEKQRTLSQRDAALFKKKLQDEVDAINERVEEANRELREIRKARRASLESEEAWVRFSIMWLMPILVFILGMTLFIRRKVKQYQVQGGER
jgi:ABC-type uncharacterized transport system involved in gliding motility auxiliary subunit